jgi:hypothetical protein
MKEFLKYLDTINVWSSTSACESEHANESTLCMRCYCRLLASSSLNETYAMLLESEEKIEDDLK